MLTSIKLYADDIQLFTKRVDLPGDLKVEKMNKVVVDLKGTLWIGTNEGLYSLNGRVAKLFKNKTSNHVTALFRATDDLVWVGYKDGSLARFGSDELFISYQPTDSFHYAVSDIVFDQSGNLWWSTYGNGIYCQDEEKTVHLDTKTGLNDNYIYDLEIDNAGKIWAASDKGISICEINPESHTSIIKNYSDELPDLIVRILQKDNLGNIWLGFHQGGIGYFDPLSEVFYPYATTHEFGQINDINFNTGSMWIASSSSGLTLVDQTNNRLNNALFAGKDENIYIKSITIDRAGYLWILTKKALYVSNGGNISVFKYDDEKDIVHAILSTGQNEYWTAEKTCLVFHKNNKKKKYLDNILKSTTQFTSLVTDKSGQILAGTMGEGIFVLNPKTGGYFKIDEKNGLVNDNVLSLAISDNTIWTGTLGGASEIILDNNQVSQINSFDKEHGLGNNFLYTVFVDHKNRVWFGTDGNGLLKYENGIFYTYDEANGINDDVVYSITEDDNGQIWFSTSDGAIYSFDDNEFVKYNVENGLDGETVFSLAAFENSVFALTEAGLNILNPASQQFVCLNEELGFKQLQSDLNSVSSGENCICFGTYDKMIKVNKYLYSNEILQPTTSINRVTVNLEPVKLINGQSFTSRENRFVFEYSGSWPLAPNKLRYKVKLDGYDPDWKITYDRSATYPNLSPGKYTFHIKAFLSEPANTMESTSFSFIIYPPFYTSVWFIVLLVVMIIGIVYWIVMNREKRLRSVETRKKEQLEFEYQTLKNQVNPHFLFNSFSTLISIIEEDPNEAVVYTEALSGFFRDILEVKEEPLILVSEELRMLSNYSLIHQKRLGDNFKVEIQLDESIKTSKIPPLTLQLLAENALKHNIIAKDKPIKVAIRNDEKTIIVENNKRLKKQTEQSTGIGLRNISERYKLISGMDIVVEETSEIFRVKLPTIK